MQHTAIIPAAHHGMARPTDGSELVRTVTRLRGYDAIVASVEFARIEASKSPIDRALENGGAYVMTMDDFLDRFPGAAPLVRTDAVTGRRYAFHALGEFALDVPLCSGCDNPLPLTAHCSSCDEDMSK